MKKIITAMISQELNNELKKEKYFEVICNNIQYKEAIIDIIDLKKKNNLNIDILILDEQLPGEINLEDLILNIKKINNKIKIIIILENENSEIKQKINNLKIKSMYYINNIDIKSLIQEIKINEENTINKIKKEYNKVKNRENKNEEKIVTKENIEINNYLIFQDNKNKEKNKVDNLEKNIQKKSLIIIGNNENIKEKFIYYFNKLENNKKILIINFNIINYKNKYVKLNDYVDVVFWRNNIYKNNFDFNKELNKLLKKYNYLFLDFEINNFLLTEKNFINNENIILILENNFNQIKLNYKKINKIKKYIKIILYSENKYKLNKNIIKILFRNFKIIGEIKLFNKNKVEKNINKIIIKLIKKINK